MDWKEARIPLNFPFVFFYIASSIDRFFRYERLFRRAKNVCSRKMAASTGRKEIDDKNKILLLRFRRKILDNSNRQSYDI